MKIAVEENGIAYEFESRDSYMDITGLDLFPETGQDLINFFLECDVSRVVPALKQEIVDCIRSLSFERSERRVISQPVDISSIRKESRV